MATATRTRDRRAQLLDAANRVVMREGPEVSMNSIAAEAGITKPILYRHFGDKGGLFRALAERHTDDLLERLRQALTTRGGRRDRTRTTLDAYLSAIEERPQIYRFLMHRASVEEPDVRGEVASFLRRLSDQLAAGIRVDLGLADDDPRAVVWAHGIVGMAQNAGEWWLDQTDVSRAEVVEQLTELLWGALARPTPAHARTRHPDGRLKETS